MALDEKRLRKHIFLWYNFNQKKKGIYIYVDTFQLLNPTFCYAGHIRSIDFIEQ